MTKEEKLEWAKTLKVGDVVCDCRYNHFKIKSLSGEGYDMSVELVESPV